MRRGSSADLTKIWASCWNATPGKAFGAIVAIASIIWEVYGGAAGLHYSLLQNRCGALQSCAPRYRIWKTT